MHGGSCIACTQSASCTPGNPCDEGKVDCSNGPKCVDTGNHAPNGTPCNDGGICDKGNCL